MLDMFTARHSSRGTPENNAGPPVYPLRLAVGVVSRSAVDAACDVAAYFGRPIYLVASRAQVGSFPTRPGYVNGWVVEDLVRYLHDTGRRSHALVVRDHGGPLQHAEDGPSAQLPDVLNRACEALAADVKADADAIHLDMGAWIAAGGSADEAMDRLAKACEHAADGRPLQYEVGVDPQSSAIANLADVDSDLEAIRKALPRTAAQPFVVLQLGTLVAEDRNVGDLEKSGEDELRKVRDISAAAQRSGMLPKAHNCDYLSPRAFRVLGQAGVYCNIAPQYAVLQNRLLARLLDLFGDPATKARVAEVVRANGGWRKWTAEREPSDVRIIELAAHYVLSEEPVRHILSELDRAARSARLPGFDEMARRALRQLMLQQAASIEGMSSPCR